MLNEFYTMQRGLEKVGKLPPVKHNDIKSPGMGTTFRILLEADGNVERVELLDKDRIKDIWSIGNGNKNQFPAIKLTFPLIPDAHKEYVNWKKNIKNPKEIDYREFIHKQVNQYDLNLSNITCWPSYRKYIICRTRSFKKYNKDEKFFQIFERFRKSKKKGINILSQIYQNIKNDINSLDIKSLSANCDVLFGTELDKNGNVKDGKRVTFLIDALPSNDIDHYASSRREVNSLSTALFALEENGSEKRRERGRFGNFWGRRLHLKA